MFLNLGFRVYYGLVGHTTVSIAISYSYAITSVIVRLNISARVFDPVGSYIPNPKYPELFVQEIPEIVP